MCQRQHFAYIVSFHPDSMSYKTVPINYPLSLSNKYTFYTLSFDSGTQPCNRPIFQLSSSYILA